MKHDLKELERRAYRATFQDGLWDIYLGLVFVAFGVGPLLRSAFDWSEGQSITIHITLLLAAIMILILGKRYITTPRLGYVRFGAERKRKLAKLRVVLAASVVAGFVLFAVLVGDQIGLTGFSVVFGITILVVLGSMAFFMDYNRLFVYAILWAFSMPLGVILEDSGSLSDAPIVFVVTGGIAVIVGLVFLQRFLHDYRLPEESHG